MSFSVLDRKQSVHQHLFLEASAGTGKTFAIENIVARLLTEETPLTLEKILVVTFTKAATRDLNKRIRSTLERNILILKQAINGTLTQPPPDYLNAIIERGEASIAAAKRSLEDALFTFDHAHIYTIHGFCWRMLQTFALEADIGLDTTSVEEGPHHTSRILTGIRDFLHTQLVMPQYSTSQLSILMQRCKKREDALETEILNELNKGLDVSDVPSFEVSYKKLSEAVADLISRYTFERDKIIQDILLTAESYKGLHKRDGSVKGEFIHQVESLADLLANCSKEAFNTLIESGLCTDEHFVESNLKIRKKATSSAIIHYPNLVSILNTALAGILNEARNSAMIFARVVKDCRSFLQQFFDRNDTIGHQDLLHLMKKAVKNGVFANKVQNSFTAVIVDEFQDTDPLQWDIFSDLFCAKGKQWNGFLHLVGDPKQSIYAFRQADIYTYLNAAQALGSASYATLDTNYRSLPLLVKAVNTLFSSAHLAFPLPHLARFLPFRPAEAGRADPSDHPPLQFIVATVEGKVTASIEESYIFPAIATEIMRLHKEAGIMPGKCAILVSDRYQADRMADFLHQCHLPVKPQRGRNLSVSPAVDAMRELIDGVLHYQNRAILYTALAGKMIALSHRHMLLIEEEEHMIPLLQQLDRLRSILRDEGFALFYQELMKSKWMREVSVLERILGEWGGSEFYREWQDLADLLIEEENAKQLSPYGLLDFLDNIERLDRINDERLSCYVDPFDEGVSLLTTHVSKGLEFDVVFALGISKSVSVPHSRLIAVRKDGEQETRCELHAPSNESDPHFIKHCEELDAEKMRQLYVALTRAKKRLYIPFVASERSKQISLGSASPIDLLLARLTGETDYASLYQKIKAGEGIETIRKFVEQNNSCMSLIEVNASKTPDLSFISDQQSLTFEECSLKRFTDLSLQSFTSLTLSKSKQDFTDDVSDSAPHDFEATEKSAHTLPAGPEIGVLLHKIFETIPFDVVKKYESANAFAEVIDRFTEGTDFHKWRDVISHIIYNALTTRLPGLTAPFCLADVDPQSIYREMPFLYPCNSHVGERQGIPCKPGYLKGVIDLFFAHEEKYYLLDWKSNWLGPDAASYKEEILQHAMKSHYYDLQAEIYSNAMEKYLKLFDERPFKQIFGGTFYLFLRGVSEKGGIYLC